MVLIFMDQMTQVVLTHMDSVWIHVMIHVDLFVLHGGIDIPANISSEFFHSSSGFKHYVNRY